MLLAATQDARDRFMSPWVNLEVAASFGRQPQLNPAIGANISRFCISCRILDGHLKQPLAERAAADFTLILIHCSRAVKAGYL
jgi:hypothetical protein